MREEYGRARSCGEMQGREGTGGSRESNGRVSTYYSHLEFHPLYSRSLGVSPGLVF
jgi:hypothetical protein